MPWPFIDVPAAIEKTAIGKGNQILSSEIEPCGRFPVVDQGQAFIAGYSNAEEKVIREVLPLVIFGDHTRCLKYVDFAFILGADGTKVLKPRPELFDAKFFYFALLSLDIPNRGYNRHFTILKDRKVPRPEKDEQQQIAGILELVQRTLEQQERLIALTTELKKALLHQLFTQGLRGEPKKQTEIGPVPKSWVIAPLGELIYVAQYGMSVKGNSDGNYPILRMTNQIDGQIVSENLQFVKINGSDFSKFKVDRGDILFNRTNSFDLVGRTAIFDIDGDFVFASYLIRLKTNAEKLNPHFLNSYFSTDETQARLKSIATRAVSQSNISATRLKGFVVPLPSLGEQAEIVTKMNTLNQKLSHHQQKRDLLQNLFHTLLHELMTAKIRVHNLDLHGLKDMNQKRVS